MAKKSTNNGVRLLIGAGSLLGFLGGWIILGESPNPYAVQTTQPAVVNAANTSDAVSAADDDSTAPQATPTTTIVQLGTGAAASSPVTASSSASGSGTVTQSTTARTTRLRSGGS